jgi:mRNA-degrading endonuclease RelE of RelBE toxin-antitoxin system
MSPPASWRVEFDPGAARDLRKLGAAAEALILRFLRERIATADDPRRFGKALTADLKGFGAIVSEITAFSRPSKSVD